MYDCVVVHVGTNDTSRDFPKEILRKYERFFDGILRLNHQVKVVVSAIIPRGEDLSHRYYLPNLDAMNQKISDINAGLEKLCDTNPSLFFCRSFNPSWEEFLARDGLHLNPKGIERLGKLLVSKVHAVVNSSKQVKDVYLSFDDFPPLPSPSNIRPKPQGLPNPSTSKPHLSMPNSSPMLTKPSSAPKPHLSLPNSSPLPTKPSASKPHISRPNSSPVLTKFSPAPKPHIPLPNSSRVLTKPSSDPKPASKPNISPPNSSRVCTKPSSDPKLPTKPNISPPNSSCVLSKPSSDPKPPNLILRKCLRKWYLLMIKSGFLKMQLKL